jgi:hypothetical protein
VLDSLPALPTDVAELCRLTADIPGTDLARLIATLSPDADAAEQALRDIIAQAKQRAAAPPDDDPGAGQQPTAPTAT